MSKIPITGATDGNPFEQGIESIMMTVKNVAAGLVAKHGVYHKDAPTNPYSIRIGSFVVRSSDTHHLTMDVADELLRRLPPHCPLL